MTTPSQLKIALQALGWQVQKNPMASPGNLCTWDAFPPRAFRDTPSFCTCNNIPPGFMLQPYSFEMNGKVHSSVTFSLFGQIPNERWVDFKVYSVDMKDALQEIGPARDLLFASWEAAFTASLISKKELNVAL